MKVVGEGIEVTLGDDGFEVTTEFDARIVEVLLPRQLDERFLRTDPLPPSEVYDPNPRRTLLQAVADAFGWELVMEEGDDEPPELPEGATP